jgi:hypothetical protein
MDHLTNTDKTPTDDNLTSRRQAKGYSHEDLAIATGLTIEEIILAEAGGGPATNIERIESVLR